jgi:hypothetical protein
VGSVLSQWTLIRGRGSIGDSDDRLGVVRLRNPDGAMRLISLAPLSEEARAELRELASGSKVPQRLLERLLAGQRSGGGTAQADTATPDRERR